MKEHQVYILFSKKLNRFYIGYTFDLEIRLEFHAMATQRKFTSKAKDWEVFITIPCVTKCQALLIESHIKRMKSKQYILNLKKHHSISEKLLIKYKDC